MRLSEWKEDQVKWDMHKKFHIRLHGERHAPLFTQFESGEMTLRWGKVNPDHRLIYKDIGVQIVAGHDPDCPKLMMPDGTKVPNAWVKYETLVVDLDTRIVVSKRLEPVNSWVSEKPDHAKKSSVYWPFPGARPQGGQISIVRPKKLTKAEKNHITTLRAACKAWYEFSGKEAQYKYMWASRHAWTSDDLLKLNFAEMINDDRRTVALNGYKTSTYYEYVDYLLLAEG